MIKNLNQYIKSKKSILDNLLNSVDILNEILIFFSLEDFVLNK